MGSSRYFQQQELDVVSGGLPEVTDTLMADRRVILSWRWTSDHRVEVTNITLS